MIDEVIDVEAKVLGYMLSDARLSGLVSFDMRAAFPSFSREYLFSMLKIMGLPNRVRSALKQVYLNCFCLICIGWSDF